MCFFPKFDIFLGKNRCVSYATADSSSAYLRTFFVLMNTLIFYYNCIGCSTSVGLGIYLLNCLKKVPIIKYLYIFLLLRWVYLVTIQSPTEMLPEING